MPDFAAQNVLWNTRTNHVTIIDFDSCSCRFRGVHGMVEDLGLARTPGVNPVELLKDLQAKPDAASDNFALATLVFQIVHGRSLSVVKTGPGIRPLDPDEAVLKRGYPLYQSCGFDPPTYAINERDVLEGMHKLWIRAFLETKLARHGQRVLIV